MKRRWIHVVSLAVAAAAASGLFLVFVLPSGAQTPIAEVTPMRTITPYQLQAMHLFLGRAPSGVALTASEAEQALIDHGVANNAGPILETTLATCSMAPPSSTEEVLWANRPCWVISVKPVPTAISTPPGWTGSNVVTPTIQYALVDANTGEVFDQALSMVPPQASP